MVTQLSDDTEHSTEPMANAYTVDEIATKRGRSTKTIKRIIKVEQDNQVPDRLRVVPGGRYFETMYWIERAIWDKGIRGELPEPTIVQVTEPLSRDRLQLEITGEWVSTADPVAAPGRPGIALVR